MDSKITINISKRTIQIDNITRRYGSKESFWEAYDKLNGKANGQKRYMVDRKDTQDK